MHGRFRVCGARVNLLNRAREASESSVAEFSKRPTGASYYRARYYDPLAGRFIGEDPIGFSAGENFYTYTDNESTDF